MINFLSFCLSGNDGIFLITSNVHYVKHLLSIYYMPYTMVVVDLLNYVSVTCINELLLKNKWFEIYFLSLAAFNFFGVHLSGFSVEFWDLAFHLKQHYLFRGLLISLGFLNPTVVFCIIEHWCDCKNKDEWCYRFFKYRFYLFLPIMECLSWNLAPFYWSINFISQ